VAVVVATVVVEQPARGNAGATPATDHVRQPRRLRHDLRAQRRVPSPAGSAAPDSQRRAGLNRKGGPGRAPPPVPGCRLRTRGTAHREPIRHRRPPRKALVTAQMLALVDRGRPSSSPAITVGCSVARSRACPRPPPPRVRLAGLAVSGRSDASGRLVLLGRPDVALTSRRVQAHRGERRFERAEPSLDLVARAGVGGSRACRRRIRVPQVGGG